MSGRTEGGNEGHRVIIWCRALMNLISTFLETAQAKGSVKAIVAGDGEAIDFSSLARWSGHLAGLWRAEGVRAGDRVLVAMPVGIALYAAIAGLWRIGATIVFPEPALGLTGLRHAIRVARPKAFLATDAYRLLRFVLPELWWTRTLSVEQGSSSAEPVADVARDHPALISFTSGSTGAPKGIVRSHSFLAAQDACVRQLIAPQRVDETDLVAFPVFVIANLGQGVTSVLPNWKLTKHESAPAAMIAEHGRQHGVTRLLVPPSICETLAAGDDGFAPDTILTGGGPVFPDLLERLSARLPRTDIVSVYGSTEAEPIAHQRAADITASQWQAMRDGKGLLAGRPIDRVRLSIVEDEIIVTGGHVNKGYLDGRGDAENKLRIDDDIWHRTGDAGRMDEDGLLWLRGRHSARAGSHYPFEVEVAARSWPGVRQAALVPASNPPTLAIEGEERERGSWQKRADTLGSLRCVKVDRVPLDRRHASKVDYARLRAELRLS
jgi:acyl-CoA synthetase (AMP-forming)/AMP-acid ligase II